MNQTCWVLTGPTASGKTALSLRLAMNHNCEIICMDSMQIYRGMDIGTAKPTADERGLVPHHMVDVVDAKDDFSVAQYQEMAEACIEDIQSRGKRPLLVGGTGFYLRALRQPMAMGNVTGNEQIREELQQIAEQQGGRERLHRELEDVDPQTAARLHVNDVRRVIRALEVYRLTGCPFSQQTLKQTDCRYRYRAATLTMDRKILYQRIDQRVDQMIDQGLVREIQELLASGLPRDAKAFKAIGYKELIPYCMGEDTLENAIYQLKLNTRHYAKRQLTWMRREEDVLWVDSLAENAYQQLENYYTGGNDNDH